MWERLNLRDCSPNAEIFITRIEKRGATTRTLERAEEFMLVGKGFYPILIAIA